MTELEHRVAVLTWLHAELLQQLDSVVSTQQHHIAIMAWLHAELVWQLQQVLGEWQTMLKRAKALRIIKTQEARQKAANQHANQ
jgi:hypothetical protein